nr:single-stranded DNA-binding protein MDBP [Bovine gammaherpesvirus 4]
MAMKTAQGQQYEDNIGSKAPIGPCGYIYVYKKETFPTKEASLLGNGFPGTSVMSVPLLFGLTVEPGFPINVKAVHKKIDTTTVSVKVTSYHREVIMFSNIDCFTPIFHGTGLPQLCQETRDLFGFTHYSPPSNITNNISLQDLCGTDNCIDEWILGVVITEGFKERLYHGHMIPLLGHVEEVQISPQHAARKIPLYDEDLFSKIAPRDMKRFHSVDVSQYLFNSLYTAIAQAIRVKDVATVIQAMESQFVRDQHKMPKVVHKKDFPSSSSRGPDGLSLMIMDSVASELAVSYGLSFIDAPQDMSALLDYTSWPIFVDCITEEDRLQALHAWNLKQSIHVNTQLFSTNSMLYLTRIQKQNPKTAKGDLNVYNSYYLQHGLSYLSEATQDEYGQPVFQGVQSNLLSGSTYTIHHLAYAASMCPNTLARYCYYLQFCQHQKSTQNQSYNISNYVGTAASSDMCNLCQGKKPAVCINTLFYRLRDRFPPIITSHRRDPYIITGSVGMYNDLDILGNFASFREKEDEGAQVEEVQKYTYWQLTQTLLEKLEGMGIKDTTPPEKLVSDIPSFIKVFKDIDAHVDTEVLKFINCMVKNNINFRETIKSIHHVIQYCCNVFAQPPCPVFLQLYYKSILTIIQDVCLPNCMMYEQDNSSMGMGPTEWLKMHYQTLWTNFKGCCFDRGVLTGAELKVMHSDPFCDFFDVDAAINGIFSPTKTQVRISRAMLVVPKTIKIKNRIIFSNSSGSEAIQSGFLKSGSKKDNYIVTGPYMKFLNIYHKIMFPQTKMSSLFMWHTFSTKKQIPLITGVPKDQLVALANYIEYNSKLHSEIDVLDIIPDNLITYAKIKLNNAILRACGQTQFYSTTLHCLVPTVRTVPGEEYPHVLENEEFLGTEQYLELVQNRTAQIVQATLKEDVAQMGKLRPIITVPMVINKYTGINGNNGIFHCGNLGYFMGRGVDRNLIFENAPFKRQSTNAYMRKKHVFMTPIVDNLIKRTTVTPSSTFEVENIRRDIMLLLEDKDNQNIFRDVVLELVKGLGQACADLTADDLQFYLGEYYIMSDEILSRLQSISDAGVPWCEDSVSSFLGEVTVSEEQLEFIGLEEQTTNAPTSEDFFQASGLSTIAAGKKRKLNCMLSDFDL